MIKITRCHKPDNHLFEPPKTHTHILKIFLRLGLQGVSFVVQTRRILKLFQRFDIHSIRHLQSLL